MGWIYAPKRQKLAPARSNSLSFVHENINMLERCHSVSFQGTEAWSHSDSASEGEVNDDSDDSWH